MVPPSCRITSLCTGPTPAQQCDDLIPWLIKNGGKRFALPNSRILIHQPSAGFEGQSTDIEIHAREILSIRKRTDEIYAKHTGQTEEQVHVDMERDRFFTAQQAVEYGLIDRVISSH